MQIDKQTIVDLIHQHGNAAQADQAHQQLPDKVDTEQHQGLLEQSVSTRKPSRSTYPASSRTSDVRRCPSRACTANATF